MKPLPPTAGTSAAWLIRIALGAVFVFASAGKIMDPAAFASIIANYRILPPILVEATAVVLPWIEALCGLALIFGRFDKGAAMLICLMMVVFIGLILYNGYRGLNVACGCFSLAAKAPANVAWNTGRNLLILAVGTWLLFRPRPMNRASLR